MVGLIAKVLFFVLLILAAFVLILDKTGAATWGTISFSAPDVAPCQRYAATLATKPVLVEVRWIWNAKGYGWGCHLEFGDDSTAAITPMPK